MALDRLPCPEATLSLRGLADNGEHARPARVLSIYGSSGHKQRKRLGLAFSSEQLGSYDMQDRAHEHLANLLY